MEGIGTDTRLNPCVVYYLSPSTRTYRLRMPLSEAAVKTKVFSAHFAIAATADWSRTLFSFQPFGIWLKFVFDSESLHWALH